MVRWSSVKFPYALQGLTHVLLGCAYILSSAFANVI